MSTKNKIDLKTKIIDAFKNFENNLNGDGKSLIHNSRQEALDKFVLDGFPTMKHEKWKYNNLSFLRKIDFNLAVDDKKPEIPEDFIKNSDFAHIDAHLIVLVNGKLDQKLSNFSGNGHFQINPLAEVLHRDAVKAYFGKIA